MNTIEQIDVNTEMTADDFCTLFEQLPLNDEERKSIREGDYAVYKAFLAAGVKPVDAWVAARNIFAVKNQQIKERMEHLVEKINQNL
jgi:hypothetical protein